MFSQRLKYNALRIYYRFIKLKGAPSEIALGFSLGVMIGMTPFLGVHIIACVSLAALLGWSKIAALVGCQITNVFTAPLIYPVNYWVGLQLAGLSRDVEWSMAAGYGEMFQLMKQSPLILADLFFGGLVLGLPMAVFSYFLVLKAIGLYRKRRPVHACLVQKGKKQCPAENKN
ncbi:MAG: DUF2062 domain-containing protein [Desulfosarcina sp.]|jgi:hypothetical protein